MIDEVKANKSLGQNFLEDETILKKIADVITTKKDDLIIEIGPGKGALTKYLINKDGYFLAYEVDKRMQKFLNFNNNKAKFIWNDFLEANIEEDAQDFAYHNIYIIANIPYYITTPIIKKALTIKNLNSMAILMQKEVAQRLCAKPHSKNYGSLTVYLNYYFDLEYLFEVKKDCFRPVPKVDSAVVKFQKKKEQLKILNEELFFKVVEDAFRMKRKTLRNNLKNYDFAKIKEVLDKFDLNENVRAEEISLEVFGEIANNLGK